MRGWLTSSTLRYAAIYCFVVVWIHVSGMAGRVAIPQGRSEVVLDAVLASPKLGFDVAFFLVVVAALHLLPFGLLLVSLRVVGKGLRRAGLTDLSYFLVSVLCFWLGVLAFNKLYFPNSSFAYLLPFDDRLWLTGFGVVGIVGFVGLGVLPAAWRVGRYLLKLLKRRALAGAVGLVLAVGIVQPLYSRWTPPQEVSSEQPNIIVIGLDSVSPVHIARNPGVMSKLEQILQESTVFDNTLTPVARTFPAWTSVLTARYPVNSGARFNLTAFGQVEKRATLAKVLKGHGYATIYAQDERKFNNIDETFGFDSTVGPTPGAAEFVLVAAADQPLANLIHLTPWAPQLFPFVALNRASALHYEPDEFVKAIIGQLPRGNGKPLFLAAHFCLAHQPYAWRTRGYAQKSDESTLEVDHIEALRELDRQVDQLILALRREGRLENAILVVLSDHGESLGYENAAWVSPERYLSPHDSFTVNGRRAFSVGGEPTGHGTDVLDGAQYRSLLAFRAFGSAKDKFPAGTKQRLASLVDVSPTLMSALALDFVPEVDGLNLMGNVAAERVVPTETGMRFSAMASIERIDENALFKQSKDYYRVEPETARLVLKPERYADAVAKKDIALHTDDWMLALLRNEGTPFLPRVALLVHKPTGAWTTGNDQVLISRAPMATLRKAALSLYGKEIDDFRHTWFLAREF